MPENSSRECSQMQARCLDRWWVLPHVPGQLAVFMPFMLDAGRTLMTLRDFDTKAFHALSL